MRINIDLLSDKLFDEILAITKNEHISNVITNNYIYCLKDISIENLKKYEFINNVWDRKSMCDMALGLAVKEDYRENAYKIWDFMSELLYKYLNYYIKLREAR